MPAVSSGEFAPGPVLVVSDLHLDVWKRSGRDPLAALPAGLWQGLAALIVAGDLSNRAPEKWPRHLRRLTDRVDPARIHVLPGNHDYYGLRLGDDAHLAALCAEAGVSFAQKKEIRVGRWRFLCATLWTDFTLAGAEEAGAGADFRRIAAPEGEAALRPAEVAALHRDHARWLEARLAEDWPGETAVVTHHAPHPALLAPGQPAAGFASDLGGMIGRHGPRIWFCGHTHWPGEVRLGETLLRNVSLGTPDEVPPGGEAAALRRGLISCD